MGEWAFPWAVVSPGQLSAREEFALSNRLLILRLILPRYFTHFRRLPLLRLAGGYNAVRQFNGRFFGGRTVKARFYDESAFNAGQHRL